MSKRSKQQHIEVKQEVSQPVIGSNEVVFVDQNGGTHFPIVKGKHTSITLHKGKEYRTNNPDIIAHFRKVKLQEKA